MPTQGWLQPVLRTLNNSLCPEATPAGWKGIAGAVFLICLREITAAAKGARRKLKRLHPFSEGNIVRSVPQLTHGMLIYVSHHVTF